MGATLVLDVSTALEPPPQGLQALKAAPPLRARLVGVSNASVDVSLHWPPTTSRAEARWLVDRVRRGLGNSFELDRARLSCSDGTVDADTLVTLGLDLHHAFSGAVDLPQAQREEVARVGAAEDLYRAWVNEDPTTRTSVAIARDVVSRCAQWEHVSAEVLEEQQLEQLGLNLLVAVGGASAISPPRLVIARYLPPGSDPATAWMLLGKGVTFDTGGINVKPYESFVSMMKNDMGGAALAWALFAALVDGGYGRPLTLVLPTCENPIGEGATRPGSLVTGYAGVTVRIDHTDAEGRLIMADGLAYATQHYPPERVLTFATLTTASLRSYGPYATPVHFAPPELEQALATAADATGHDLHFFERRAWHFEANRDPEGDVRNTARLPSHAKVGAGSRNAAHFFLHFSDTPLTHFDVFCSTWNWAGDAPGAGYGATGAPLRTVLRALEALPVQGGL